MLLLCYIALTLAQTNRDVVRETLKTETGLDPFVTVINSAIAGQIAYTHKDLKRIYVDMQRFVKKPKALRNVLRHEMGHTKGGRHGDGTAAMNYHVSVTPQGEIVEDSFVL